MAANIPAGEAYVKLGTRGSINAGLSRASRHLRAFGGVLAQVGKIGAGLGASLAAAGTASVLSFAKAGDHIAKMSDRTGASAEALSELRFAAEQSGTDLETLEKGLNGLSRSFYDLERGGKASIEAFDALGLSYDELAGMSIDGRLEAVADGLAKIEDASRRGAIAQQIFGRSGRAMLPLLNSGAAGMRKLREEAKGLGLTVGQEQAAAAAALSDAMARAQKALTSFAFQFGAALGPTATALLDVLQPKLIEMGEFFRNSGVEILNTGVLNLASAFSATTSAFATVKLVFKAIQLGLNSLILFAVESIGKLIDVFLAAVDGIIEIANKIPNVNIELTDKDNAISSFIDAFSSDLRIRLGKIHGEMDELSQPTKEPEWIDKFKKAMEANAAAAKAAAPMHATAGQDETRFGEGFADSVNAGMMSALKGFGDGVGKLMGATEDVGKKLGEGIGDIEPISSSAAGAFNSAAAARLGQAGGVDQKQLETMMKSEVLLRRLVDLARGGGIVWGT